MGNVVQCTSEDVGVLLSGDCLLDSRAVDPEGRGLYEEAGDGLDLGAPGQRDGGVLHVADTHPSRRTDVCREGTRT